MFKFEELNVYKEALEFVNLVYDLTKSWPESETFGLADQFRRAAVSITLNIAEGTSRTRKDFGHFIATARGSTYESVAVATIAHKRGYLTRKEYDSVYEYCTKLAKMLSALKSALFK